MTRRQALLRYGSFVAASPAMEGQHLIGEPPGRIAPVKELVNTFEFEDMAKRKVDTITFAGIAGSDRAAFDRITYRPRLMVDTRKLDLGTQLFGQPMFTPILVGPVSRQKRFHPDGELAMVRGASAAKAALVVADKSSYPIDKIAGESKTTLWYQVYAEPDLNAVRSRVQQAIGAGCKALCITLGSPDPAQAIAGVDWSALDRLRQGVSVPVLIKGIMSPAEAQRAVKLGAQGIVVSNYSPKPLTGIASPIEVLPSIADAVGGRTAILIDGSFRRGSDVLKALALGAQAVMLGRPPIWGLAAYGADGVQTLLELVQTELARDMAMSGRVNVKAVDSSLVKIHRR